MKINTQELKTACDKLIDRIEALEGSKIVFDEDFYWVVNQDSRCIVAQSKPECLIGSLVGEVESLKELASGERQPNIIDLHWVAAVFDFLAQETKKSDCFATMTINELRKIFHILICRIRRAEGEDLLLDIDFYWEIEKQNRYLITGTQPECFINSLADDVEVLKEIALGERGPNVGDFEHIAAILNVISYKIHVGTNIL